MTMICAICNRPGIRWMDMGPSILSHTECPHCGGVNCQRAAPLPEDCTECDGEGKVWRMTSDGGGRPVESWEWCPVCEGGPADTAPTEPEPSKPREPDSWDRIMRRSVSR